MSAINLKAEVNEESSGGFGFTMTGLNSESVTPNTFVWTLTDRDGTVINSREDVSETPGATTWIFLSGDDLADDGITSERCITIKGTLDTTLGGVARLSTPYTGEYIFDIKKLKKIPSA